MGQRFNIGDAVVVNKDIERVEGLYAKAGEAGEIEEVFRNPHGSGSQALYAKVRMGGTRAVKTFRLTSLSHGA